MEESNTWAVVWMHTIECVSLGRREKREGGGGVCVCVCVCVCVGLFTGLQGEAQDHTIRF